MKRETVKCAKSRREMERDSGEGGMEEGNEMKRKEERGI
jgi:hypothetical protein